MPTEVPVTEVPVGASNRDPISRTPAGMDRAAGMTPMRPMRPRRPRRPSRPGLLGTVTVVLALAGLTRLEGVTPANRRA